MPPTTALYRIRPGYASDIPAISTLFTAAFGGDSLMDILYPTRHAHPADFATSVYRLFRLRYWTPGYYLTLIVDDSRGSRPVGVSWWRRPLDQLSFYERWVSPYAWVAPIMRTLYRLHSWAFPLPSIKSNSGAYVRVMDEIQPSILNTQRRREAWYLSTLGVDPSLQGQGLGSMLLKDGLEKTRVADKASWLVGVNGVDSFYARHGFVEVARANVGELKSWEGGAVMFTK